MKRRLGRLGKGLLLALSSLIVFVLLLEVAVRLFDPAPRPKQLRPGFYQLSFPLVNGREDGRWAPAPPEDVPELPREKADGELRIVTFGESSVEGCPWGQLGSPAAFLQEELARQWPERRITVVNAGKTSSFMMDSYYYLLGALRYDPDYVIFYQGSNDRFDRDPEMCRVASSPNVHTFWRWAVENSQLLWVARTMGPEWYLSLRRQADAAWQGSDQSRRRSPCDADTAFAAWADILVATARAGGATPVVVGFVENALEPYDRSAQQGRPNGAIEEVLLRCALRPQCSPLDILRERRGNPLDALKRRPRGDRGHVPNDEKVTHRNRGWRAACRKHEAAFVEFTALARQLPEPGALLPPLFVDGVHLSLAGYAIVGEQMARAVAALEQGEAFPERGYWLPGGDAVAYYDAVSVRTRDRMPQCEILPDFAELYMEHGRVLHAGQLLRHLQGRCPAGRIAPLMERYRARVDELFPPRRGVDRQEKLPARE